MQLPASAVSVGEGPSINTLRQQLGTKRCLIGNFDPILLRDGKPEQVAKNAAKMVRENAAAGGYIFNTGEGVMADSPTHNVEAMIAGARTTIDQADNPAKKPEKAT